MERREGTQEETGRVREKYGGKCGGEGGGERVRMGEGEGEEGGEEERIR